MQAAHLFERRPLRYTVSVDGRPFGTPFRTSKAAETAAEELRSEAPWAAIEVWPTYVANPC
jgi:hypothetical protein